MPLGRDPKVDRNVPLPPSSGMLRVLNMTDIAPFDHIISDNLVINTHCGIVLEFSVWST